MPPLELDPTVHGDRDHGEDHECEREQRESSIAPDPLPQFRERAALVRSHDPTFHVGAQVGRHLRGRRVSRARSTRHRLLADRNELARRGRSEHGQGRRWSVLERGERSLLVRRSERHTAGERVIEDRADRVDVGARTHLVQIPARLLGCHVLHRAENRSTRRLRAVRFGTACSRRGLGFLAAKQRRLLALLDPARETPVRDVRLSEPADEDVRGLEIPVHDALLVRIGERVAHLEDHFEHASERPTFTSAPREFERLGERDPTHEGHREVGTAAGVETEVVHREDPWMLESRGRTRFEEESTQCATVGRRRPSGTRTQRLQREVAVQVAIVHACHDAHASACDARELGVAHSATVRSVEELQRGTRRVIGRLVACQRFARRGGEHRRLGDEACEHAFDAQPSRVERAKLLGMRRRRGELVLPLRVFTALAAFEPAREAGFRVDGSAVAFGGHGAGQSSGERAPLLPSRGARVGIVVS